MEEVLDTTYHRYDEQEVTCQHALERHEAARTTLGRFVTGKILDYRRSQLAAIAEEVETGEFEAIKQAE